MRPRMLQGGAVLVKGPRFDLEKVLDACDELVADIGSAYRPGRIEAVKDEPGLGRAIAWPDPGKAAIRGIWREAAKIYEAVDEPVVFPMEEISLKAYPLGKSWLVYHPGADEIRTPDGRPLGEFDPTPTICVYGRRRGPNAYRFASAADIANVGVRLMVRFAGRGLDYLVSNVFFDPDGSPRQAGFIRLPHAAFGDGFGDIRVRCVLPDGRELDSPSVPD